MRIAETLAAGLTAGMIDSRNPALGEAVGYDWPALVALPIIR